MRHFIALAILLCAFGGLYLLTGPDFYWPARYGRGEGVWLTDPATRLLGAALLTLAALGVMTIAQARHGYRASNRWQFGYFALLVLAIVLMGAAASMGQEIAPP